MCLRWPAVPECGTNQAKFVRAFRLTPRAARFISILWNVKATTIHHVEKSSSGGRFRQFFVEALAHRTAYSDGASYLALISRSPTSPYNWGGIVKALLETSPVATFRVAIAFGATEGGDLRKLFSADTLREIGSADAHAALAALGEPVRDSQ